MRRLVLRRLLLTVPTLLGASLIPLVALWAVLFLVRNTDATRAGIVREI